MGGRIDIILMWVKFGDDPISSLDFSFIGGFTLNFPNPKKPIFDGDITFAVP